MKRGATSRGNAFIAQFEVLLEDEGKYSKRDTAQLKETLSELDGTLENELKEAYRVYSEDKKALAKVLASRANI